VDQSQQVFNLVEASHRFFRYDIVIGEEFVGAPIAHDDPFIVVKLETNSTTVKARASFSLDAVKKILTSSAK
jgi:hypothetical protein